MQKKPQFLRRDRSGAHPVRRGRRARCRALRGALPVADGGGLHRARAVRHHQRRQLAGLDERMELLEALVDPAAGARPLMPGTGACSLADAVVLTKHAVELGCGGVLMLPPFYYKAPSEEGLFRFFAEVIEEVGDDRLKVYLYHIPPVAQVGFSLPLIGRLIKEFPDIVVGLEGLVGRLEQHGGDPRDLSGLRGVPGLGGVPARRPAARARRAASRPPATSTPPPSATSTTTGRAPDADKLQADITAPRKAIQAFPMIPALKALIAHYRQDPGWAKLRPPFVGAARRRGRQGHPHARRRARLQARFRQGGLANGRKEKKGAARGGTHRSC